MWKSTFFLLQSKHVLNRRFSMWRLSIHVSHQQRSVHFLVYEFQHHCNRSVLGQKATNARYTKTYQSHLREICPPSKLHYALHTHRWIEILAKAKSNCQRQKWKRYDMSTSQKQKVTNQTASEKRTENAVPANDDQNSYTYSAFLREIFIYFAVICVWLSMVSQHHHYI